MSSTSGGVWPDRFGAHQSIAGGLHLAFERGEEATCATLQIFNKSNNQWAARDFTAQDLELWFAAWQDSGLDVACAHNSYLINLASPDPDLQEKSYQSFKEEVERCQVLLVPRLVFHPGSHVGSGAEAGMARISTSINRLFDELGADTAVTLCLETTAGTGSNLGSTFEELAQIIDGVEHRARMGICLDTCHIFAAGYAITERGDYTTTMQRFDATVGIDRLQIIHMNDSKMPLGSRRDRHEDIGGGLVGLQAFGHFVNDARLRHIPMVLETPKGDDLTGDISNLRVLRGLQEPPS
ncbi:MAG: deoxyribonuclease IV [Candidatus Latescibacteria bacterium]|jgi:deoxyribonuclease-4|nr:deoxyribonuclease IV [Candidatus Latescibacterota bacterium]MDP7450338.1 deoxyribonuclease IV [Candidatus Latescibacterota bacterium]HJP29448.1 deoxyribonuclease IV [Candidatus Latescibacterota bacterium]